MCTARFGRAGGQPPLSFAAGAGSPWQPGATVPGRPARGAGGRQFAKYFFKNLQGILLLHPTTHAAPKRLYWNASRFYTGRVSRIASVIIAVFSFVLADVRAQAWVESVSASVAGAPADHGAPGNPGPGQAVNTSIPFGGWSASSQARLGTVGVSTLAFAPPTLTFPSEQFIMANNAGGAASGDSLALSPGSDDLYGQTGSFTATLQPAGSLAAESAGTAYAVGDINYYVAMNEDSTQGGTVLYGNSSWPGYVVDEDYATLDKAVSSTHDGAEVYSYTYDSAGAHGGQDGSFSGPAQVTSYFTWGQHFNIVGPLSADSSVRAAYDPDQPSTALSAADHYDTLSWGGITGVSDENGAPLTDYTVISASGTDYTKPISDAPPLVPEASAGLVLIPVMAAVLLHASRRLWRARPDVTAGDRKVAGAI